MSFLKYYFFVLESQLIFLARATTECLKLILLIAVTIWRIQLFLFNFHVRIRLEEGLFSDNAANKMTPGSRQCESTTKAISTSRFLMVPPIHKSSYVNKVYQ